MPRYVFDFVRSHTSQLCAYFCIHVPMVEPSAASQTIRKLRWASALATRDDQWAGADKERILTSSPILQFSS